MIGVVGTGLVSSASTASASRRTAQKPRPVNLKLYHRTPFFLRYLYGITHLITETTKMAQNLDLRCGLLSAPFVLWGGNTSRIQHKKFNPPHFIYDSPFQAWYKKAAAQGLAPAQYNLALLYRHGRGVTLDCPHAAALFRMVRAD